MNNSLKSKPVRVVIDTNIWVQNSSFLLRTPLDETLLYTLKKINGKIALPEVIRDEVIINVTKLGIDSVEKINKSLNIVELIMGLKPNYQPQKENEFKDAVVKRFDIDLKSLIIPIPFKFEHAQGALARINEKSQPNGENNQQFKDSAIWEAMVELLPNYIVHFITKDKAFFKNKNCDTNKLAENLLEDCQKKGGKIYIHKEISSCLTMLQEKAPAVDYPALTKNVHQFINNHKSMIDCRDKLLLEIGSNSTSWELADEDSQMSAFFTEDEGKLALSFILSHRCEDGQNDEGEARTDVVIKIKGNCLYEMETEEIFKASFEYQNVCWQENGQKLQRGCVFDSIAFDDTLNVIKVALDIMRKDKGLNGELDRLLQLTWLLFLKLLDNSEKLRESEAFLEGKTYEPIIDSPYRWRDWATYDEGMSGETLLKFINNEKVILPSGEEVVGLLAYLRGLQSDTGRDRQDVIRQVFEDTNNRMISGPLLRDVINKVNQINFDKSEEVNILSHFYESMLKEMCDAAGYSGKFYTPRPVVRFMVKAIDPKLGETISDPACGTGGFLVEAYEYLKQQCKPKDWTVLQSNLSGVEAKPLVYMLVQMNLLLHGVEYSKVERKNSLARAINSIGAKDQVDIILTNPPFGGIEKESIKGNFPPETQTSETALLFIQLIMRSLKLSPKSSTKRSQKPSRAAIVVPNDILFGDGVCAKVKEKLLAEFNLHTIVRLPNGVFAPYTGIPTNLLFFDASGPTETIWFYELPPPEGRKNYTKTKPIQDSEFEDCLQWWSDRRENERAWKYEFKKACKQAKKESQVKGDGVYWEVFNLDKKNPNVKNDFEHLPPEQLVADIWEKEQRILEILGEIKTSLSNK